MHKRTPTSSSRKGQRFRCMVCGAEALVIRAGDGQLHPKCCNQPMVLLKQIVRMYHCSVCGAEVAVIGLKSDNLHLVCCNIPMRSASARAPEVA
jgi:desulfoferrodoxin-like iron-binding protein